MYKKKSYTQSEGLVPAGMTAGDYFEQAVSLVPNKPAIFYSNKEITYRQLDDLVSQLAESLLNLGIRHGDNIALFLPDCPEYIIASQAILKIGAVKVPLNISFKEKDLQFALLHSKARAIIMASEIGDFSLVDLVASLRFQLPALEHVIVKGRTKAEMISLRQLLTGDNNAKKSVENYMRDHPVDPDDIAAIVYTSGTTAAPKGVVHTHNTIYRLAYSSNYMREVVDNEVWLGVLPLSSAVGVMYLETCPIISRSSLVLPESNDPEAVLRSIQKYKVTSLVGMPLSFVRIMKHPHFSDYDVSSVRDIYFFGATAPKEILMELQEQFKCTLTITYGAGEYGHATMAKWSEPSENMLATSGKPIYGGVEVKIVNSNVQIVPCDQIGEIYVRGFGNALEYWGDSNRTDITFCNSGWIHVHDLGFMDNEGNVTVIGRFEDIIVRGGYHIYPCEIESYLYTHPKVADVSIVGYPDQKLGEKTCAFIIPKDDATEITYEDIASFLRSKIAEYKIPDQIKIVSSFPVTINDKVQKFRLREMLLRELTDNNN
ncbi:Short-chain-fatty-acid--CoA ligase [Sporotomaculum syntrophicum]|uniref:Short-chain-fatty-acid--CoA ligase n=1 Tax=Sporotomaculum syntrophicum TaxID=182264 RepID=A0A9D2WSS0_9FIRM|nr:class I adenylate-forming enzyme family protein [Sporotomaculum syntrophicum]KAF1086266.1 Short-chain-fatty-acid--CoA ligase [Sporotomaculum syntrophicum]